jgi:hypothetical protein
MHTELHLFSITPNPGSSVGEESALVATLDYSVQSFKPGRFQIIAQFNTTTRGITSGGGFDSSHFIPSAAGRMRFCVPLRAVWGDQSIARPFRVRFLLNKIYQDGLEEPLDTTRVLTFPSESR